MKRLLFITLLALLIPIGMRAQEATNYGLTVAGVAVTSANASDIRDASRLSLGSFDAETNTLTLNNATIDMSNGGSPIESSITNLTIKLVGSNTITVNNNDSPCLVSYTGEQVSSSPSLTFDAEWSHNEARGDFLGDITINGINEIGSVANGYTIKNVIESFSSDYNPNTADSEPLSGWKYITLSTNVGITIKKVEFYDLWVDGSRLWSENLSGGLSAGPVYDPVEGCLVYTGGTGYPVVSSLPELVIDIQGVYCGISSVSPAISFQPTETQTTGKLRFIASNKDVESPRFNISLSMEAGNEPTEPDTKPFEGFSEISYENDLVLERVEINYYSISKVHGGRSVVQPTGDEGEVVTMGEGEGLGADIEDSQNSEVVVNNGILYSLGEDDGYYQDPPTSDKLVMLTSQQNSVPTSEPGTTAFNRNFKGIVLRVPAGTGVITVNAMINGEGVLNVQVGGVHKTFKDLASFMNCVISYASTKDCWAYIFNSASETPATSRHRAPGKKMPNTIGIKSVSVSARRVASAPPPSMSPKALTKEMVAAAKEENHIAVSDKDVTSIASDAFVGQSDITYVDLSGTSITGNTIDRTEFPADAIILLPAGNTTAVDTKNVVIGGVCEDLLLDDGKNFEIPSDFTAVKVAQKREYTADKNSTVCLPYALDETQASALGTFYEPTAIASGTVTMTSVTKTEANVPYMLKAKGTKVSAEMVEVKKPTGALAGTETRFVGTYSGTTLSHTDTKQYYCFTTDGTFIHVETDDVHVKPFRAYIALDSALGRSLDIDFGDGTTGIKNLKVGVEDNVYYDLQGRRVLYPKKGIYIQNGKKVIIK